MSHTPKRPDPVAPVPIPVFYRPETYRPEESIGYLMRQALDRVAESIEFELEDDGLTSAQWLPLLRLLWRQGSTVAELARECRLDVGGMTRMLDRLEAKGLVRRVRSQQDRRVVNLELTAEGQAVAHKIPAVLCGVQNAHLRGFSEDEWQLLRTLLHRILDNAAAIRAERSAQAGPEARGGA